MTLQNHGNLLERRITCSLTNSIDSNLNLTGTTHHAIKGVGCSHTQIVMTVGRDDGIINTIDMLLQILNLLEIFLRQTIACGIGDINNSSTSLDNCFYHTSKILILRTTSILAIELNILNILLGILCSSYSSLDNLFTSGVELILDMRITSTNTCMDTLALGILQSLGSNINIFLHGTS